jgi:general stress protein YciG
MLPPAGTPERRAYMAALARKGGAATRSKHPDHLKTIASSGGRATAGNTRVRTKRANDAPVEVPRANLAIAAIDDILASLEAPRG